MPTTAQIKTGGRMNTLQDLADCNGKTVAIDTETTGLEWWDKELTDVSYCCKETGDSGCIPIESASQAREASRIVSGFSSDTTAIFHNVKFDAHFLNIRLQEISFKYLDTALMVHLIDSRDRKALTNAEKIYLGTNSKRQHITEAPARTKIWNWPQHIRADYAENDAVVTMQLAEVVLPIIRELGLVKLMKKDLKYMGIIQSAERHGLLIDDKFIDESIVVLDNTLADLEQQMWDATGQEFNWRSPQQLSKAIYDGLGISKPKNPFADKDGIDNSRFADSGLYKSTCTATFLLTEKVHHPLGELVGALRESAKMSKTLEKYKELADSDRVIHASFNVTGTRTGRLSCSRPNLQNVPSQVRGRFTQSVYSGEMIRTDEYNLRKSFVARPGYALLSVDWKQMEMRMFGLLSVDPFMMATLASGKDVHGEVAYKVWKLRDKVHREWSKTIGFGLIYGMTIGSLMHKLNMRKSEAAVIRDQYLREFPRIMPWMNEVIAQCQAFGYVRYWSGRLWREDVPRDMYRAANALIQGGCADILSVAAIRVDDWCKKQGSEHRIVSFIHDEIMLEVPIKDVCRSALEIMKIMEVPDLFDIPFYTDAKVGPTYGDQDKIIFEPALMS